MRVALLSPLPPEQTGIADYAAQFRQALNHVGIEVLTPLAGQRPLMTLAAAQAWVAERDWGRIDVVHAELGCGRHSEFLALQALSRLPHGPALSATIHDPERIVWRPVNRLWSWLESVPGVPRLLRQLVALLSDPYTLWTERRLARNLDGLVTLTDTGGQRLVRRMRIAQSKVSVIPHGTLPIAPVPLPPMAPVRLVYFGFIYKGKGIEDVLDALGRIRAQQPELVKQMRFTIAGGTNPDSAFGANRSYLNGLRKRAASCGLADVVDWEFDVDARDIPALIQQHHVMVLPHREPGKLALLGQMRGTSGALAWGISCGRGAITSDARAFAEEIRHGNGVSYKQGDVSALTDLLLALLNNPLQVAAWASQAQALSDQRAWRKTGQRFLAHLDAVCQHHASRVRRG